MLLYVLNEVSEIQEKIYRTCKCKTNGVSKQTQHPSFICKIIKAEETAVALISELFAVSYRHSVARKFFNLVKLHLKSTFYGF